jgi:sugar transferase (PEP-CTERM/EpsH1 system associated)
MEHLLFLPHRIPFPPNKGDKIRSYHLLKHLSSHFHVHLATFVDDENDWQYVDTVKSLCGETWFGRIDPRQAKARSLLGLARGEPLSMAYYRNAELHAWIARLLAQFPVERFLAYSAAMAQFVPDGVPGTKVIDMVDIDSDKWAQYARSKPWPARLLYQREARCLLRYERAIAERFDATLFVSPAEARLFQQLVPEHADKVDYLGHGVDAEYFSPVHRFPNPYHSFDAPLVFTGMMDYWPNVDAVVWFATQVFPAILARDRHAVFYIVGARPTARVQALAALPGVTVTGRVDDVRPYLAHAQLAVAPLRVARGIQNKVLEAMAMAKTVCVSPQALEGIAAVPGQHVVQADGAAAFAAAISVLLEGSAPMLGEAARQFVLDHHCWSTNLRRIDRFFLPPAPANAPPRPPGSTGGAYTAGSVGSAYVPGQRHHSGVIS